MDGWLVGWWYVNKVLSDDELRASYDYYLAHPEEHFGNQLRYYRARYKVPVWAVLAG